MGITGHAIQFGLWLLHTSRVEFNLSLLLPHKWQSFGCYTKQDAKTRYNWFQKMKVCLYVSCIRGPGAYCLTIICVQGFKMTSSLSMILLNVSVEIIHKIRRLWFGPHTLNNKLSGVFSLMNGDNTFWFSLFCKPQKEK